MGLAITSVLTQNNAVSIIVFNELDETFDMQVKLMKVRMKRYND
ncbi:hypothetical protein [uncultured Desulfobacter sp.]|nr:hypothetical protein [uncultured Desulfobacter sp.]